MSYDFNFQFSIIGMEVIEVVETGKRPKSIQGKFQEVQATARPRNESTITSKEISLS